MKFVVRKTGYNETEVRLADSSKDKIKRILKIAYYGTCGTIIGAWLYTIAKTKDDDEEPSE